MCARFTLTTPAELVAELFGLDQIPQWSARYNIAPSQEVAAVVLSGGKRQLEMFRWGLLAPGEAERDDALVINARSESAATKPLFREAWASRRCLIPADGFYEWRHAGRRREPFHVRLRGQRPFAFAGLWSEEQAGPSEPAWRACTILTTEPNRLMAKLHNRMPVILKTEDYATWLAPTTKALGPDLLQPYPAEEMEATQVGPFVNSARAEGPRCLEPERQKNLFE